MAAPPPDLNLRRITGENAEVATAFLAAMPEDDRTFFMEPVDDDTPARWAEDERSPRWLATADDGEPVAYLGIVPGEGWSSHVGELRLVVGARHRRQGLGAALARRGLVEGVRMGLTKLTVELVADKEGDIQMFTAIGFQPEALLRDHFRRRSGATHDLAILSHMVGEIADDLALVGIDEAVGQGSP